MKRIRRNGGARDILAPKGIAVLYGPNDRALIARLGLPSLDDDEFVSYAPWDAAEAALFAHGDILTEALCQVAHQPSLLPPRRGFCAP